MPEPSAWSRRTFLSSSSLLMVPLAVRGQVASQTQQTAAPDVCPAQEPANVEEVVSVAHSNLARLKELVDARPALALANWDWGDGDWESALGAASHMGRRDIAA